MPAAPSPTTGNPPASPVPTGTAGSIRTLVQAVLDAMPDGVALLDRERRLALANARLVEQLAGGDAARILGRLPGEVLACANVGTAPDGCGTGEACRRCGVLDAVRAAWEGRAVVRDCALALEGGKAADLRISVRPFRLGDRDHALLVLQDIAHEKRRQVLERTFYHDVLNIAAGVQGIAALLESSMTATALEEYAPLLVFTADQLVEEIRAQRDLAAAESGELAPRREELRSREALRLVVDMYRRHPAAAGLTIELDPDADDVPLCSARVLLVRVLGNMLRNALEASRPGEVVRAGCREEDDRVAFWVWNSAAMDRDVQLQVFRRSFSTKGDGRGVGTYSMKLLTERYLGGEIAFASAEGRGTEFRIVLPRGPDAR